MYKKETKEVKEQRQVVVAVVCDNCGKENKGSNGYAIEHLINDTYQVVDRIDGTVHHQGTKRDCEVYLNGA